MQREALDRAIGIGTGTSVSTDNLGITSASADFQLFLVGFVVLFLELACIRWFAASVIFLQFFTNLALIASFLACPAVAWLRDRTVAG
jgi:hypothetical protein